MFGRRGDEPPEEAGVYQSLRDGILTVAPGELGLKATDAHPQVYAGVVDLAVPTGVATVVAVVDGSTSLYFSTGGGVIGGGRDADVVGTNEAFLRALEKALPLLPLGDPAAVPDTHTVRLSALTYDGPRTALVDAASLESGQHPLSAVFSAAHDVITAIRQLDDRRRTEDDAPPEP